MLMNSFNMDPGDNSSSNKLDFLFFIPGMDMGDNEVRTSSSRNIEY